MIKKCRRNDHVSKLLPYKYIVCIIWVLLANFSIFYKDKAELFINKFELFMNIRDIITINDNIYYITQKLTYKTLKFLL